MDGKTNERTLIAAEKNLLENNKLSMDNIDAMVNAYIYGAASTMIPLIKLLKKMRKMIISGNVIQYNFKNSTYCIQNKEDFDGFILKFFDEFVKNEIHTDNRLLYGE